MFSFVKKGNDVDNIRKDKVICDLQYILRETIKENTDLKEIRGHLLQQKYNSLYTWTDEAKKKLNQYNENHKNTDCENLHHIYYKVTPTGYSTIVKVIYSSCGYSETLDDGTE